MPPATCYLKNNHNIFTSPLNERFDAPGILHTESVFAQATPADKVICRTSCFPQETLHDLTSVEHKTGFTNSCYQNAAAVGLKPCVLLRTTKASSADTADAQNDIIFSRVNSDHSWFNSMVLPMGGVDFKYDDIKKAAAATDCPGGIAKKKTLRVMAGPFQNNPSGHGRDLVPCASHGVPKMEKYDISVIVAKRPEGGYAAKHLAWNLFDISKNRSGTVGDEIDALPPDNSGNYFIIVDQDLGLLKSLKNNVSTLPTGNTITLNMMHSVLTYSDSAPAKCTSTTSRVKQAGFRKVDGGKTYNAFDWEVNHKSLKEIKKNNPVFLSEYSVKLTEAAPVDSCTKMTQIWEHDDKKPADMFKPYASTPGGATGTQANPEQTSTRLKIFTPNKLNQIQQVAKDVNRAESLEEANFAAQRKRSGDHLQIWAAYCFPRIAAENAQQVLIHGTPQGPYIFPKNPKKSTGWVEPTFVMPPPGTNPNKMEAWYKERTFFCTHDIPAATYSIMCGVNTILNNKDYVATFNLVDKP